MLVTNVCCLLLLQTSKMLAVELGLDTDTGYILYLFLFRLLSYTGMCLGLFENAASDSLEVA